MLFSYIMGLGHTISLLKQTQRSCAALFVLSEQGLQEILHIKYLTMDDTGRSQQNIISQKYIDQMSIDSVRRSIMRNFVTEFPNSYQNVLEYSTWEEMESYVNKSLEDKEEL
jgi:hypothetical protein